jgi:hypothetical protein
MKSTLSFHERAKIAMVALAKQPAITLKEAKEQAQWLKTVSSTKVRKLID